LLLTLIILFITGCVGGLLAGLLGIGGGVVYVLVLTVFLEKIVPGNHELVRYIIANSAFAVFFAGLSGSIQQYRKSNFYPVKVILIALPAIATAWALSGLIAGKDWYDKKVFLIIVSIVLTFLMIRSLLFSGNGNKLKDENNRPWGYILTGFVTGLFGALTGLGGGIISVPILHSVLHVRIRKATSISLGVMPFFTLVMSLFYGFQHPADPGLFSFSLGYILPFYSFPLIAGVILFSPLGVKLSERISGLSIKIIFTIIVTLTLIRLFTSTF